MATPSYTRSLVCAAKRLRVSVRTIDSFTLPLTQRWQISPPKQPLPAQNRHVQTKSLPEGVHNELASVRLPYAVQATYMAPLRRTAPHGNPVCDLQLRSYSVRNVEVFADFAMRAAYFLNLPASGPVPLPKITERWTVPRSNFVHKKSQENFERITLRRLIQIKDGHPDTVGVWLAFLQKHRYYGVGMKANVWEHSGLDVAQDLDAEAQTIREKLGDKLELFGGLEELTGEEGADELDKRLYEDPFKASWGATGPMGGTDSVPTAKERVGVHYGALDSR